MSGSMNINRDNMVFAQSKNAKESEQVSLTHKNSSDNISNAQSLPDANESERRGGGGKMMSRVPSNSSYINRMSHSG